MNPCTIYLGEKNTHHCIKSHIKYMYCLSDGICPGGFNNKLEYLVQYSMYQIFCADIHNTGLFLYLD